MRQIFKPTLKYWLTEDGGVLLMLPIGAAVSWWVNHPGVLILFLAVVLVCLPEIYRLLRTRLEIDENGFSLYEKNGCTEVRWSEINWIRLTKSYQKPRQVLEIGTRDGKVEDHLALPIECFDHQRIWELVQQFAPPAALKKNAHRKTSDYQKWLKEAQRAIDKQQTPLRVSDSWLVRIGAWFILTLGLVVLGVFVGVERTWSREKNDMAALIISVLAGLFITSLGLLSVLFSGRTALDHEKVTRHILIGKFQIKWDEIVRVEESAQGAFILYSKDGYLSFPTPEWWSGRDKWGAADFLLAQIELRQIEVRKIAFSLKIVKNTKVR